MNYAKRYQILSKLKECYNEYNNHKTNLVYKTEFELLIAVLLSAKTQDQQVNKVTAGLFKIANTPQTMLLLGVNKIIDHIKYIGLFNSKAKNIIETCQLLIQKHNGSIPNNRAELELLPGVGRKTANIILNIVFNHPTIAVDTHVFRFCNRSRFVIGKNVLIVEKKLNLVVPKEFKKNCHQYFVKHGRNICCAKTPHCYNCIISNLCEFNKKHKFLK